MLFVEVLAPWKPNSEKITMKISPKKKQILKKNLVDSLGFLIVSTPAGAFLENVLTGMDDDLSILSRLMVGGLYISGLGGLIGKGRRLSHQLWGIADKTKERYHGIHDALYMMGVTAIVNPAIYVIAGSKTKSEIIAASVLAVLTAGGAGWAMGYSADVFNDLLGLKSCKRASYPASIKNREPQFKRRLAVGLTALSLGVSGLMYGLTPPGYVGPFEKKPVVEQTIEQNTLEDVVLNKER